MPVSSTRVASLVLVTLCVPLAVAYSAHASEALSGLVVAVSGDVEVRRGAGPQAVVEGFILQVGDTLIVKVGAKCEGFSIGGETFELEGPSQRVLAPPKRGKQRNRIVAWIGEQLSQWTGESRSQAVISRSARDWMVEVDAPTPLVPAPDGHVRASRSLFIWTTIHGIDDYVITIAPERGKELKHTVRGHRMILHDLEPGASYVWRIGTADGGGSVSRWSSFRVMEAEEEERLSGALRGMADLDAGVLLLSVGLHEEAIHRFDAALTSGGNRRSALRWRAEALAGIGLFKEAYEDLSLLGQSPGP